MKVAVSTDNNKVSAHFGRCPQFTIAEIENNEIISKEVIDNPGHRPGYLPDYLSKEGVDCIIAGGMGRRARRLFDEKDIKPILGIKGNVDTVLEELIQGTLKGGESFCKPGAGKGYGVSREDR